MSYIPNLKTRFTEVVIPQMQEKFAYENKMEMPALLKICLNQGVGVAVNDKKLIDAAIDEMSRISGQKAQATMSKKDISNFKLRAKMPIGARVTLRKDAMYEFLERLISIALPRVRDFQG